MARNDMHLDDGRDTFKIAGEYQTAGEYWRVRERKTVTIQRFWRGFSARRQDDRIAIHSTVDQRVERVQTPVHNEEKIVHAAKGLRLVQGVNSDPAARCRVSVPGVYIFISLNPK